MVNYEAELDAIFMALAHPARRAMLARLGRGEATVGELAEPLDISLPAVTKHLKVLERARLIHRGRDAQWRPCRLEPAPLDAASGWIAEQRKVWESRLDRLEAHLHRMTQEKGKTDVRSKEDGEREPQRQRRAEAGRAKAVRPKAVRAETGRAARRGK